MSGFLIFIGEYWLTFLFGLIAAGMTAVATRCYRLYKKGKNVEKKEENQEIINLAQERIDEKADAVMGVIEQKENDFLAQERKIMERLDVVEKILDSVQKGMLSIHGKQFKSECRYWLEPDRDIDLETYTHLEEEHRTYNSLKGNHEGDVLFNLIKVKYESQLVNN